MRDENCIFCKIANGEIPSSTVYEDEEFRAILDLGPASKGHTLILPKEHFRDLTELPEDWCGKALFLAGKTVFHFHVHVIPRYENGPKIAAWEPGTTVPEEQAEIAEKLKNALS